MNPRKCWIFVATLLAAPFAMTEAAVDFKSDIEPIFQASCLKCHGEKKPKSKFRIDQRASLLKGGDSGLAAPRDA